VQRWRAAFGTQDQDEQPTAARCPCSAGVSGFAPVKNRKPPAYRRVEDQFGARLCQHLSSGIASRAPSRGTQKLPDDV
jgi:hypothetical protein